MRKPLQIVAKAVGFTALGAVILALSPIILIYLVVRVLKQLWLVHRLGSTWPKGKFVLVAYTQSAVWAHYIEQTLLPSLGAVAVAIDRSKESWKREHPVEATALEFWGGRRNYNPIAIVICSRWRVRVFGLYDAFQKLKHGDPKYLEEVVSKLLSCKDQVVHAGA